MINIGEHKNIAKFHGWIEKPNYVKLIVENLKGGDLKNYIKPGALTVKQKIKVLLDSAEGLQYIHSKNIMHRDIKAGNIAIDRKINGEECDFNAKIYDFGVSREEESEGATTYISGTIKYNAPEQKDGQSYDSKVDIFAFAVMTFELFSEQEAYTDLKTKRLNDTQLSQRVAQKGMRPDFNCQPKSDTPQEIIDMYKQNWELDPTKRMNSTELVEFLRKMYQSQ
jgi:serine/threonine protein kinase